jgi:hypothetical protein
LLRGLEQPRRSTLADHVHRPSQFGPWVLINESWYKVFAFFLVAIGPTLCIYSVRQGCKICGWRALYALIIEKALFGGTKLFWP